MKKKALREKMFALCRDWETSGKTRDEFCTENELTLAQFGYWRSQYLSAQKETAGDFVAINPDTSTAGAMEIRYPNGVRLSLPDKTPLSTIKALVYLR